MLLLDRLVSTSSLHSKVRIYLITSNFLRSVQCVRARPLYLCYRQYPHTSVHTAECFACRNHSWYLPLANGSEQCPNVSLYAVLLLICAAELGDLDKVKSIVKLVGFVNCVDGFGGQVCLHHI
jgi:hypothetical protein